MRGLDPRIHADSEHGNNWQVRASGSAVWIAGSSPAMTKKTAASIMARENPHIGSSFESWLDEEGIREEVTAAAIKAVIAHQLTRKMKRI
jgi:hypothetical protein